MQTIACPIWGTTATLLSGSLGNGAKVFSVRTGGEYRISEMAVDEAAHLNDEQRAITTTWLVEQRRGGTRAPILNTETLEEVLQNRPLRFSENRARFFRALASARFKPGHALYFTDDFNGQLESPLHPQAMLAAMGVETYREGAAVMCQTARDDGYFDWNAGTVNLRAKAFDEIEKLQGAIQTLQAFVAMWFDPGMFESWRTGFAPAIRDAGFEPFRIDGLEHNGKIDDAIVAEIRKSRFLVADFTCGGRDVGGTFEPNPRGGVYYEAGLAHGIGMEVIFTCREDRMPYLHFDTRQFAHIVWNTPSDLRTSLYNRIAATVKEGPAAPGRGNGFVDPIPATVT